MAAEASSQTLPRLSAARLLPAIVGFSAITGQIVLMRELIVLASGNELSLGSILAAWLAWGALGSLLGGWMIRNRAEPWAPAAWVALACGLSMPATIWVLRWTRTLFTATPTELLSPSRTMVLCTVCLSGFCALSGCLFSIAVRMYAQTARVSLPRALGYAYMLETAGTGIGGIAASALFVRSLSSFQIAFVVCVLDVCLAVCMLKPLGPRWRAAVGVTLAAAALPVLLTLAPAVERISQQRQWSPLQVIAAKDSIYGRITVTDAGGMRSIYEDGNILANVPDKAAAEEAVHYALLEHPAPRRVLLLGGSATGSIAEALQYRTVEQVDVVELDPALISIFHALLSKESEKNDARVHSHFGDGRQYLQAAHARFDVIIVNVPDPETAQWNRFYTVEFFRLARERLAPGGIMALQLRSSEEFISPERAEFLRCIRATLGQVFPYVGIIPGDPIHMFGTADANTLTDDPQALVERLHARNVQTQYVSEYFIPFRMSAERLTYTAEALRPVPVTPINHDFRPVAYYFNETLWWNAQFHTGYGSMLRRIAQIPQGLMFGSLAAALLVFALVSFKANSREFRVRIATGWSVCAGGYGLMTLQILLLLTFQSIYGYLYYEIAMLIGMFMAGIALGSWTGLRLISKAHLVRIAAANQLMIAASAPVLMLAAMLLARAPEALAGKPLAAMGFPVIAFLCGIPGGLQFPVASELYVGSPRQEKDGAQSLGHGAGLLYAVDLVGGCLGALVITGFLVPVYGLWNTAWLAALVCLAPALFLLRVGARRGATSRPTLDVPQTLRP